MAGDLPTSYGIDTWVRVDAGEHDESMMRLLIVEDDDKMVAYLRQGLTEHGFMVDAVLDGDEGLHAALTGSYDVVVLDVNLPQRDGWSILTMLRQRDIQTPVLFLTSRDAVPDRVKGLELGADDYLVKPFAFSELLARVRTLLRRAPARQSDTLAVADLEIDVLRHQARRAGVRLDLTSKEFALLSLLARHQGEALSRTLIAEHVWDMNFYSETNVVDVMIRRLRRKVNDPYPVRLIHTIRGVGYVLDIR